MNIAIFVFAVVPGGDPTFKLTMQINLKFKIKLPIKDNKNHKFI